MDKNRRDPEEIRLQLRERPDCQPTMYQEWRNLLFLHWKFPVDEVQRHLPPGLVIDTFQGEAWVGLVPFQMRRIRPSGFPAVPWISNFLELNVRTYVINSQGIPGVWFFSLDASRWLACTIARIQFRLPYFWASMRDRVHADGWIDYENRRFSSPMNTPAKFRWHPQGNPWSATPGTLEFFLVERYVMFALLSDGRLSSGRVWHTPYPLQTVQLETWDESMLQINGFRSSNRPPDHAIASSGVCVDVFHLQLPTQTL